MHRFHVLVALLVAGLLLAVQAAHGTSSSVVVSQVFAGGGNAGASYTNDYVELLNRGSTAVDLSSWTVQYAAAASTSWQATTLSGTLQPGHYYLVQLASSGSVGATLPAAQATGTSNLAVSGGKVAVVNDTPALTCGTSAGSCSASVVDLVGYGSATDYEGGGAAPALSNTTAAVRASAGCTDTDDNSADFTADTPAPHNTSSSAASCASTTSTTVAQDTAIDVDVQPVLSIAVDHASLSFGNAVSGDTPPALADHVTVVSNNLAGYSLTVHRTAFTPNDLPLAISGSAPSGGQLGTSLGSGALARIPVAPATDLLVGTTSARSLASGDVWSTSVGFASPLPVVPPGHYKSTVTFTVIGR